MDQHYSYKPGSTAEIIHEHLPHLCVIDVERLADALDAAARARYAEGMTALQFLAGP